MLNCSLYLVSNVPPIAQMHEKKNEPCAWHNIYLKLNLIVTCVQFFSINYLIIEFFNLYLRSQIKLA